MSKSKSSIVDTLIIGSGLAGLSAANDLSDAGAKVIIVDKGRGVGGRLAVRRIGEAVFDHGAQFFTARSNRFIDCVAQWVQSGVAEQWYQSYPGQPNGHPRYRGMPNMASIAKHLAKNQIIMQSNRAESLSHDGHYWTVKLESEESIVARSIVITSPVPQTLDLLEQADIHLSSSITERLQKIQYESCIAVMAVLDGTTNLADPGAIALDQGPIAWISDNHKKGVSPIPAITIHASGEFSKAHFNDDRKEVGKELIKLARPLFGNANILDFQVHGWLYSKPTITDNDASLLVSDGLDMPPMVFAGDAFAGPRFEGAVLSGWCAAKKIRHAVKKTDA
jgi:predicted NAD/FAD-dependent oxidoreductase